MRPVHISSFFLILTLVLSVAAKPHKEHKSVADGEVVGGVKNATILIVRHAEKPDTGTGLAPEGEKRAKDYVSYFQNYVSEGKPLKLTHLYAAKDSSHSHRSRLTLEPLSKALKLRLNTKFEDVEVGKLAHDLQSKRQGDVVLIAWHHSEIPDLLRALDVDPGSLLPGGSWPNHQYNWVIELHFDAEAKLISGRCVDEVFAAK